MRPYLTFWALLGGLLLACLAAAILWWGLTELRSGNAAVVPGTAVMRVIPLPTFTPPLPTATPAPTVPPESQSILSVQVNVQISGTGGAGLRLRDAPSLQGTVRLLALEGEIFRVTEGPVQADDYTWWYLVAPYDEKVQGWAVANYLEIVATP